MTKLAVLLAGAVLALAGGASAAAVFRTTIVDYMVTASDFVYFSGPTGGTAPYDPVSIVFSVTLDPYVKTPANTADIDVTSFSAPYTAKISYRPDPDQILVVASAPFYDGFKDEPNTFGLFVSSAFTNNPQASFFEDNAAGTNFNAQTNTITANVIQTAVPEPAVWAMMLVGFAGLGGICRLRRAVTLASLENPQQI